MSKPARIMVVEDDDSIRETLELVLADEGYHVLSAANGAAALDALQALPADVILLDMKMPVMDGWEFARRYRALPDPKAPLIVLTAARDAAERSAEIGAEGHLAKPFDLDDLIELLARLTAAAVV